MKLSPRMLAMALAASARALATDERKARMFLAQWLWDHPTGKAQRDNAIKLLDLPALPSENWPDKPYDPAALNNKLARDYEELRGTTDAVRRMILLRRISWWSRLMAAGIENDLQAAVESVENNGNTGLFYEHTVAAPGKDRKYVRLPGNKLALSENPA